jgi:hypothetical protein
MASDKTRQTAKKTVDGTKLAYALWLVSRTKSPRTKTEFAEEHGVNRDTLYEWERSEWMAAFVDKDAESKKVMWAESWAELEWIAMQRSDIPSKVAAIREIGKLLGKYPNEKVDVRLNKMGLMEWLGTAEQPELKARSN